MKKTVFFIISTVIALIAFSDCREYSDTEKPVINLAEPADNEILKIGEADGLHFECEFSDNEELSSYKVSIHPNFDGHTHASSPPLKSSPHETVDFEFEKSWTLSGRNQSVHHHEIKIPENATAGDYHLIVYCTDAAGNETHIAVDVELE